MSHPAVVVREDARLEEIAQLLIDHGIGGVPVVDAQGHVSGIITESDFTGKLRYFRFPAYPVPRLFGEWVMDDQFESMYRAGRTIAAREVMSAPVIAAAEDELVGVVIQRMLRHDLRRLPVVRDGVAIGMLTRHDLLKLMSLDRSGE
jgi:CBS domain-containing protein